MMRSAGIGLGLILLLVVGCEPVEVPEAEVSQWGMFEGEVIAKWHPDGRNMTLREDFAFVDGRNQRWVAPAGSVVNGASIPSAFWSVIGGPFEGKYRNASVVHDVGCESMSASWQDVHKMFYDACRCGGVDEVNAKLMYYAVYHFGPRWEQVTDTVVAASPNVARADGVAMAGNSSSPSSLGVAPAADNTLTVQRLARFDPPPPTDEEVAQVTQLIAEEHLSPTAIEQLDRKEMRRRRRERTEPRPITRPDREAGNPADANDRASLDVPFNPLRRERVPDNGGGSSSRMAFASAPHSSLRGTGHVQPAVASPVGFVGTAASAVAPADEAVAIDVARRYIEQHCGEERQAEFAVTAERGALRVLVTYMHQSSQGEWQADGTHSTFFVSRSGQLLEAFNGIR